MTDLAPDNSIRLEFSAVSRKDADHILYAGIDRYRHAVVGQKIQAHNVVLYQGDDIVGGVKAHIIGDAVYMELMWIADALRRQGHGRAMLACLEREAINKGVKHAYTDTATYEAPEFYQACGYQVIATIPGYFQEHDRIFLKKTLE